MTVRVDGSDLRLMAEGLGCPVTPVRVLGALMFAAPRVVTLDTLALMLAKPGAEPVSAASVATHVSRLRRALADVGRPDLVLTYGRGWCLKGDPEALKREILSRVEARSRRAAPTADVTRILPNPADSGAAAALRRAVSEGRGRSVSWANLSKMTGKCELDLRRLGQTLGID